MAVAKEDRLAELLRQGELAEASELLVRLYARDVERFVASRGAKAVADVCQTVWLSARAGLAKFRMQSTPRVWLFAIAKRAVVDAHRADARLVPTDWDDEVARSFPLGPQASSTASAKLVAAERAAALQRVLARWPAEDRELLELRYVNDLKPAEIAELVEARPNTVSQRIVRLAARLREELAQEDEFASRRTS
jgi:RNA polymerase sigma-70 factor (ECF subfamily)